MQPQTLPIDVVTQTVVAFNPQNRIAGILGALVGGLVPTLGFVVAHYEVQSFWSPQTAFVAGSLLVSAITVWQWAQCAFENRFKATGFVLALEGVMLVSQIEWLAFVSLVYLVAINAISTAYALTKNTPAKKTERTRRARQPSKPKTRLRRVA